MHSSLLRIATILGGLVLAAACGSTVVPNGDAGTTGSTTTSTSSASSSGGTSSASSSSSGAGGSGSTSSSSSSSSGTGGASDDCAAISDAIAAASKPGGACTTTVRLDYTTKKLLGHRFLCGGYHTPTEAEARATAQSDAGFGQSGPQIAGSSPKDAFVFFQAAGDFGGSAAVAAHTGLTVFGGSTVWSGTGAITYPLDWLPASALGPGCGPPPMIPPPFARGFDLGSGQALPDADVKAALDVVWSTALPLGLVKVAYVFDAVVLLYPRSVGAFDPSTAEWIVLVDSGYLE